MGKIEVVFCPHCGMRIERPYDGEHQVFALGTKLQCKKCKQDFIVNCTQVIPAGATGCTLVAEVIRHVRQKETYTESQGSLLEFMEVQ